MNHYPRHLGDYIRDTVGLTMLEDGAYTRLLDQYYVREAPLPADKPMLYRIARAISKQERAAVENVLRLFFLEAPDGWHQKRADLELQAQCERSASARQSAKLRWEKEHANADADAMRTHSDGNASQKPVASSQTPKDALEWTPTSEAPLPKNLTSATWALWKAHLANKGKGMSPQQERLSLVRLAGHADPEAVVLNAIERGHRNLEPVGGWRDKPTLHDKRSATAAAMKGHTSNAEPTDITAESQRVA